MIDDARKTAVLTEVLKNALPFPVELSRQLAGLLKARSGTFDYTARHEVVDVSYAGDAGGIMCRIASGTHGDAVVVSLTHVEVGKTLPFAAAVAAYQKHRVKKLRKQP